MKMKLDLTPDRLDRAHAVARMLRQTEQIEGRIREEIAQELSEVRQKLAESEEIVAALTMLTDRQDAFIKDVEEMLAAGASREKLLEAIRTAGTE